MSIACEEYATVETVREMEAEVEDIQILAKQSRRKSKQNNHEVRLQISEMAYQQAQTEQAFVQMGAGFNMLVETVSVADQKTERVAKAQYRLRRQLEEELQASGAPATNVDLLNQEGVWWADAETISSKEKIGNPSRITVDFGNNQLIAQSSPTSPRGYYSLEIWGSRLYAIKAETNARCLEILSVDEHFIRASDCQNAMIRYQFSPLQ